MTYNSCPNDIPDTLAKMLKEYGELSTRKTASDCLNSIS